MRRCQVGRRTNRKEGFARFALCNFFLRSFIAKLLLYLRVTFYQLRVFSLHCDRAPLIRLSQYLNGQKCSVHPPHFKSLCCVCKVVAKQSLDISGREVICKE